MLDGEGLLVTKEIEHGTGRERKLKKECVKTLGG